MMCKCQHLPCGREFKPWRSRQKFCSHDCHDLSRRAIDVEVLRRLALTGMPKAQMARELNVSWSTVRRAIGVYGFQRLWQEQRYI